MNKNQDEIIDNRDYDKSNTNNHKDSLAIGIALLAEMTRIDMERSLPYFNINQK